MRIEIFKNGELVETKELKDGQYHIGRAESNEICLKSNRISKQHGLLVVKSGKVAILDLGSSNGIFVNGILIKKQRVTGSDQILLGEFQIKLGRSFSTSRPGVNGNLAEKLDEEYVSSENPQSAVQSQPQINPNKIAAIVEKKILIPLYGLMKTADWRWILGTIIIVTLVSSVLLAARPLYVWSTESSTREGLDRAHTVLNQIVRENLRLLQKGGDYARFNVDAWENVRGFEEIYILDGTTGNILAPVKLYNKSLNDGFALLALKKVVDEKAPQVTVEHSNGSFIVAQPIPQVLKDASDDANSAPAAVVLGKFESSASLTTVYEPILEALIFAVFLGLLAYFLILKMVTHPIKQIQEQLDSALRGEPVSVSCDAKFEDLENLAQVINFSVSKLQQANGNNMNSIQTTDNEQENGTYIKSIEELDYGLSDGILLLDREKKVIFVGHILEELIGLKTQYAKGQNISDCCRDPGFAGTAIDMCERVIGSLGENQDAVLDINGINRGMSAVGHRNSNGEIRFVLITVKMEGG